MSGSYVTRQKNPVEFEMQSSEQSNIAASHCASDLKILDFTSLSQLEMFLDHKSRIPTDLMFSSFYCHKWHLMWWNQLTLRPDWEWHLVTSWPFSFQSLTRSNVQLIKNKVFKSHNDRLKFAYANQCSSLIRLNVIAITLCIHSSYQTKIRKLMLWAWSCN